MEVTMTRLASATALGTPAFVWCFLIASSVVAAQAPAPRTYRPKVDVTAMVNRTTVIPAHLVTPAMAQNIGPGSHLLITIPGEGTFGCTANFVWADGGARYLGA